MFNTQYCYKRVTRESMYENLIEYSEKKPFNYPREGSNASHTE